MDSLPTDLSNMPIYYSNSEKELLQGTCDILNKISYKKLEIKTDYDLICEQIPQFESRFTLERFCFCICIASSRIFGFEIDGKKTGGFVPFADMINHKRPKQVIWSFNNKKNGFQIEAIDDLPKNSELYDSYGKKCNSRFLLNYGFVEDDNDANEISFKLSLDENDPLYHEKQIFFPDIECLEMKRTYRFSQDYDDAKILGSFGFLRFYNIDNQTDFNLLNAFIADNFESNLNFIPEYTPPLSIGNETKVLNMLERLCQKQLDGYPTTISEDLEILGDKGNSLSFNEQNCVKFRMGEKLVLGFLIEFCKNCIQLFYVKPSNIKMMMNHNPYSKYYEYLENVVIKLSVFNN